MASPHQRHVELPGQGLNLQQGLNPWTAKEVPNQTCLIQKRKGENKLQQLQEQKNHSLYVRYVYVHAKSIQLCLILHNPITVECQAPLSMVFSRQEHQSGFPCPSPGDLPDPGMECMPSAVETLNLNHWTREVPSSPLDSVALGGFLSPSMARALLYILTNGHECLTSRESILNKVQEASRARGKFKQKKPQVVWCLSECKCQDKKQ